jgi:tetratricopeptide (TPR) repeat protein
MPGMSGPGGGQPTPRQEAEQSYALAYEEIGKAKKDLEDGKAKNAQKKFRRALERCEKAVQFDERYHEAWNLLGFTARKLGDYDKAFKAYDRCLEIKPDYAPAREYLGEAWLEKGDAKQARLQLVWLERLGATEELKTLRGHYDAWAAAHPDSAAAPSNTPPAPADTSTAAGAGTSGH